MHWFTADAPIRLKLLIAFGTLTALTAASSVSIWLAPGAALPIGLAATLVAGTLGLWFREAIARPYVTTVVRMEALAAGDLDSPIEHTQFKDCVGRMTKAMFTFRDGAREQIRQNGEAEKHACIVRGMTANIKRLSAGDLDSDIVEVYPPSYSELRASFNSALACLRRLIGSVATSSDQILTGTCEIAQASEDLAKRTEINAANLEEASAAIVRMDDRLKAIASAADRTAERAEGAMQTVSHGRNTADEAVQAMRRISESAKGIDGVIEGLDKIAFQTRVLAMNAAVEAGRAGEAGRGFAVVADLVSALAMRAEEEAGRAREQLTTTQSEIGGAVDMVGRVDGALTAISTDVSEVHGLITNMAAENMAQSAAIGEISGAVGSMNEATQQNAAMVEETSAVARNLKDEAQLLSDAASKFTLSTQKSAQLRAVQVEEAA